MTASTFLAATDEQRLAPGVVLLVGVPLDRDEAGVSAAAALLDAGELQRARRFLLPDVSRRFVVSHAALRAVLGPHADVPPRRLVLGRSASGKPELLGPGRAAALRFNLSHAGELAVIAVTRRCEVGIDIEPLRPLPELLRLASRILSPEEAAAFRELPPEDQAPALLRCWTRKEALLKAVGCGLRVPMPSLHVGVVRLPPAGAVVPDPLGSPSRWRLLDIDPGPGWVGSLALEDGTPAPRLVASDCPPLHAPRP